MKRILFLLFVATMINTQGIMAQEKITQTSKEQIPFSNVTFEPGCRNNWHIHHATKGGGQMLPGDVIHIPANVKHWHGAAADSWFAHLAFEVPGENTSNGYADMFL